MGKTKVVGSAEAKPVAPKAEKAEKGIVVLDSNGVEIRTFAKKDAEKAEHYAKSIGGRIKK